MPQVKCFEIDGIYCWFWSNDHDPPHFHAKKEGKWEIRVKFTQSDEDMFEHVRGCNPKGKTLRLLRETVKENREHLFAEWEASVQNEH
jgi:hypothetical protein